MIATKPFILYTLPKSRTTQAFLQGNKIEKIWHDLESFLNNCTTTSINKPSTATLTVYTAYEGDKHPELAKQILSESQAVFGKGKKVSMGTVPDYTIWQIKDEDLLKAVEYLQKGQPWPKSAFGPVELYVAYDFKLIDPDTGIELPNQEHTSMMLVWLSKRCSCSADLWFPFLRLIKILKPT